MDSKYVTDVNFLPSKGLLYVDTCGLSWITQSRNRHGDEYRNADIERRVNFYNAFKERGNVITTNMILDEIKDGLKILKNKRNKMNGYKHQAIETDYNLKEKIEYISKLTNVCGKVYALLRENMKTCIPTEYAVQPKDVRNFVENFVPSYNKTLSPPDKELVTAALSAGPISSLLTADVPMMEAYCYGAKEFQLQNHFFCNAIHSTINYPLRISL